MSRSLESEALPRPGRQRADALEWLVSTDHKRVGLLTLGTALVFFFGFGGVALTIRAQLAQPGQQILSPQAYNQMFTMHGTGMIALSLTPLALGLGVYLVPLQIGAPAMAAPRLTLLGFWLYLSGSVSLVLAGILPGGAADGWWGYTPLSNSIYSPGPGMGLWGLGVFLAACGMIIFSGTITWTILTMRAPGVSMMRLPVFSWMMLATCLMGLTAFPFLLAAVAVLALNRLSPHLYGTNGWNMMYEHLFWFYGHPVVYIMFFPFVGCVAEVLAVFSGRRFFGYKGTALAILAFAALSMGVWGHHLFASNQVVNDYYSLNSILLLVPAGIEYLGMLGTITGGRLRYRTPMLFALAFIPQFLIGGLTGIMAGTPAVDYHVNNSYFVVAHFHYTLFAGSVFGLFAGLYFWLPKATGIMFSERLGKLHFVLMVIGTNVTFGPMFGLGILGMPRRVVTYQPSDGFTTLSLISSIGAGILGMAMLAFAYNLYISVRRRVPAPADPWEGHTLEWATSSPPPRFNFDAAHPVPRVCGYAPLLDLWEAGLSGAPAPPAGLAAAGAVPPRGLEGARGLEKPRTRGPAGDW